MAVIASEDVHEVRSLLHKLTGSAGMYGFYGLSDKARSVYNLVMKDEVILSSDVLVSAFDDLYSQMLSHSSAIEE